MIQICSGYSTYFLLLDLYDCGWCFVGAINSERSIVETDDDDDYSIRRLADETKAKIARKMDAAQAATKQA